MLGGWLGKVLVLLLGLVIRVGCCFDYVLLIILFILFVWDRLLLVIRFYLYIIICVKI